MKIKHKKRINTYVPVSSMSDIAFLLLIFIMLLSLINNRKEIKIDYPEAKKPEVTQKDKNFEIYIDKEGFIYYSGKIIDFEDIENILVETINKNPDTRVHVIADRDCKYKNVDSVLNILKLFQHRLVSLVAKEIK
ncbi:MAG: biopolymer transporter ExbD [Spirochaetes bacterium]|nr:biopolymer transporter ExbD [Spirochaetota bacterium]